MLRNVGRRCLHEDISHRGLAAWQRFLFGHLLLQILRRRWLFLALRVLAKGTKDRHNFPNLGAACLLRAALQQVEGLTILFYRRNRRMSVDWLDVVASQLWQILESAGKFWTTLDNRGNFQDLPRNSKVGRTLPRRRLEIEGTYTTSRASL